MSFGILISSSNYNGQLGDITYYPDTGGTVSIGVQTIPYTYNADYYYGSYEIYFSGSEKTCYAYMDNPFTNFLLQENYSLILQEDNSGILTEGTVSVELTGEYSPGSVNIQYVATSNLTLYSDVEISFVDTLETISGAPLVISGTVLINSGNTVGTSYYSVAENYNNLSKVANFTNVTYSVTGQSVTVLVETNSQFDVTPTPTISVTPSITLSPTPTPSPTPINLNDGLILDIDAFNTSSYPGSGTTVQSLVGSYPHTLTNGASYQEVDCIKYFDLSSLGYSLLANTPGPTLPTTGYTYVSWAKIQTNSAIYRTLFRTSPDDHPILVEIGTDNLGFWDNNGGNFMDSGYDVTSIEEVWVQYSVVGDNSTSVFYINNTQVGSTVNGGAGGNLHYVIGNTGGNVGSDQYWGDVSTVKLYGRKLSLYEISQLYNEYKDRYTGVCPTPTPTASVSQTPSTTPSISISPTPSISVTPSVTPSITVSTTPSVTPSISVSTTPSITVSISVSQTPSISVSPTASVTPSITVSPSVTPSITISPSITPTPSTTPTNLYSFSSFTFTSASLVGRTGPSLAQIQSAYSSESWTQDTNFLNMTTNGYQRWTVPQTGTYEFEVAGAQAASVTYPTSSTGGRGVIMKGRYSFNRGDIVEIIVGQQGAAVIGGTSYNGAGGGGGSFVVYSGTPLIVAGGGGGDGAYSGSESGTLYNGLDAVTTINGTSSVFGAPGGTNGNGGESHTNGTTNSLNGYDTGAGAGFLTDGENGNGVISGPASSLYGGAGLSYSSGFLGGPRSSNYTQASDGGFGGAGGGSPICGGGGGGYSGGGGAYRNATPRSDGGGGGGSYIISGMTNVATTDGQYNGSSTFEGNSITNLGSYNTGGGYISVTLIDGPSVSVTPSVTPTSTISTTPSISVSVSATPSVTPTISTSPSPTVESFTSVGTTSWTAPAGVTSVEYLVVGGGGGGGNGYDSGGGGGAGGGMVLTGTLSVSPGNSYTVTVGNGGTGGADTRANNPGTDGSSSVFDSITATGGQGGYGSRTAPGGLGIGGLAQNSNITSGRAGNGGGGGGAGGGGGGAGGNGTNRISSSSAGVGGAGISSSISGSLVTYGGGGNGGTSNVNNNNGATGAANTGKGGGAGSATGSNSGGGGNGGSGIVVLKYFA